MEKAHSKGPAQEAANCHELEDSSDSDDLALDSIMKSIQAGVEMNAPMKKSRSSKSRLKSWIVEDPEDVSNLQLEKGPVPPTPGKIEVSTIQKKREKEELSLLSTCAKSSIF
jgi:hypothetical protein